MHGIAVRHKAKPAIAGTAAWPNCWPAKPSCASQVGEPNVVLAAVLRASQKEVVIKVLKPGVEDVLLSDLNFLKVSSQILEFVNPQLARTSLAGIVADIR